MDEKVYIDVNVAFRSDGSMLPRSILWSNGRTYPIDRVLNVRACNAARCGGQGDRYTVMMRGQRRYLYFEHGLDPDDSRIGRWFVEQGD